MGKFIDLTGQKFGKLTVIKRIANHVTKGGTTRARYKCLCDCGNSVNVLAVSLKSGNTQSCSYSCGISEKGAHNFKDLLNKTFGRLTVVERADNDKFNQTKWICKCSCGKTSTILGNSLLSGNTKSCGCLKKEITGNVHRTHGDYGSPEYYAWSGMIQRCTNTNTPGFKNYGGKGVKVCDRWLTSYENFLEDMGRKPDKKYSLDRTDVYGNYEKSNCQWVSKIEQANNKRNNNKLTYNGETKTLPEWGRLYGLPPSTILYRMQAKWPPEKILNTPKRRAKFAEVTIPNNGHKAPSTKHGMSKTPEHNAWLGMKQRCYNPNYSLYHRYGGRGITVCDEFLKSFEAFLREVGLRPSKHHSLDRIDTDGNYCVGNIRWADRYTQANNKTNNSLLEFDGETKTLSEWGRIFSIKPANIRNRIKAGWSIQKALTEPLRSSK